MRTNLRKIPLQTWTLFLVLFCVGLGLGLRAWLVFTHPIWLDENYSLLFALTETPGQLLIQSRDPHPGFFYACLKGLLFFTKELVFLRVLLSTFPQVLGGLLVVRELWKKNKFPIAAVLVSFLLFLNSFLVYLSFQLRMYGMVCFVASLTYLAIRRGNIAGWKNKNILWTCATLFLGNAISYSYFFVSGGVLLFMVVQWYQRKRGWPLWAAFAAGGFVGEFLLLAGFAVKRKFEDASWIPLPNLENFSSLFLTTLGIKSNYFLEVRSLQAIDVLFYLGLAVGVLFLTRNYRKIYRSVNRSIELQSFLFVVIIPMCTVILASFLMRFLSQRFFFYQFVPKLSLFLPRVFTPFVIIGSCLFADSFANWMSKFSSKRRRVVLKVSLFTLVILSGLWIHSYFDIRQIIIAYRESMFTSKELFQQAKKVEAETKKQAYFLPSWVAMSQVDLKNTQDITVVTNSITRSETLSQQLFSQKGQSCSLLQNKVIFFTLNEVAPEIKDLYNEQATYINSCCQKLNLPDRQQAWECQ